MSDKQTTPEVGECGGAARAELSAESGSPSYADASHTTLAAEVFGDGLTVWVNGSDGMCLARFCPLGVDIHKEFEAQAKGEPPCRYCTQGKTGLREWRTFQTLVRRYYGIGVGDDLMPVYVREEFCRA